MDEPMQADDEARLKEAIALSLQTAETRHERVVDVDVPRREDEQLLEWLGMSRQNSGGSASPSAVQVHLSKSKLAAVPTVASSTAASARGEQTNIAPMRSWFSVPVPDVSDLPMVYPSPLRRTGSGGAASASPRVAYKPPSSLLSPSSVSGLTCVPSRSSSRLRGQFVEHGVGMAAAVSAWLAGTWTDWATSGGVIQPKPQFCITIKPLDGQVLFGVHIVLLEEEDGRSEQHVVRMVEGGIEVVEGEAHFAGLTAELEWNGSAPILQWSNGNSWRKAHQEVSELYSKFYTTEAPPPPPSASPLAGRPQPQQGLAEERRRFTSKAMESRRPPPSGCIIEDVPGTGACLFHAVRMTQDVGEARQLRQAVVRYVVEHWEANPDISAIMGAERRAVQPTILLQDEFCRQYGDTMIQSAEVYQLLMERDGTYAEQSEAAVAAMLLGVELTIYASAAPPGVDPSPQNLYPEASGLDHSVEVDASVADKVEFQPDGSR